jgi:ABC-type xylose transport system permease subunit
MQQGFYSEAVYSLVTMNRLNQTTEKSNFWERSDRVMAMASGGAALGAMVGQIPGAIIGAALAAAYGWYSGAKSSSGKSA